MRENIEKREKSKESEKTNEKLEIEKREKKKGEKK